jgi:hypothetical protein
MSSLRSTPGMKCTTRPWVVTVPNGHPMKPDRCGRDPPAVGSVAGKMKDSYLPLARKPATLSALGGDVSTVCSERYSRVVISPKARADFRRMRPHQ